MKVGILTMHKADNYGAVAQAYALQQTLRYEGYEAKIIDYVGDFLKHPLAPVNWRVKGPVAELLTLAGELSRLPRRRGFRNFRMRMECTQPVLKKDLPELSRQFDWIIAGSDQVWNYRITNSDGAYFLDFVQAPCKKGSYAASVGLSELPEDRKPWYREQFRQFDFFNLREKSALPLMRQFTDKPLHVTIDPVFLLPRKNWESILERPPVDQPYILTYQVGMDKRLIECAAQLSKETGYPVYSIPLPQGGLIKARPVLNASPEQWLGWIANAAYVVTDSFHGTAFSIVFERQFFVNYSVQVTQLSSRIRDLLEELGITGRNLSQVRGSAEDPQIDYEPVRRKLEEARLRSMNCLRTMLEGDGE